MELPTYESSRFERFLRLLREPVVDLARLEALAWNGIPRNLRPRCWRLLLRYEPPARARCKVALERKRREYCSMIPVYYEVDDQQRSDDDMADLKQVSVDVPRTAPEVPFFQQQEVQRILRRLLYIWGVRHPASGYVQGVNDLVTPFLMVFLSEYFPGDMPTWHASALLPQQLVNAEADSYWCLCKLLERVQDVYTAGQPGIRRCLRHLENVVNRVDHKLTDHFQREGIDFFQFAFRWANCMLIREIPFDLALRLWDTYLAEGMRFGEFLPYVCAAFLLQWSSSLVKLDFQDIILFLQHPPTSDWTVRQVESVLSHAHMFRATFDEGHSMFQL